MEKVSNEELVKISSFLSSCNDMINGKFILVDIKITKILNVIADSEELYKFIAECSANFAFDKELHRAEVKNRFNGGAFILPEDEKKVVAMVFCLLVEFDAKRIDFYNFMRTNFATLTNGTEYSNFANTLLVPFRNIIAKHFGLDSATKVESIQNAFIENTAEPVAGESTTEPKQVEEPEIDEEQETWNEIYKVCDNLCECLYSEKKLKPEQREELLYIIKTVKYSVKYKDARIISALLTAFDHMTKKCRSVQFVFNDMKECLRKLYNL